MTQIECSGLNGANPLHALAALGLLRLADRIEPEARLGWRMEAGAWRPVVRVSIGCEPLLAQVAEWVQALARRGQPEPSMEMRVRTLNAEVNRFRKQAKEDRRKVSDQAKRHGIKGKEAKAFINRELAAQEKAADAKKAELDKAREAVANSGGMGIAHWGDIIGVTPNIVRRTCESAVLVWAERASVEKPAPNDARMVVGHLPALACDQVEDSDKVVPTPFSFSNGSGGQCLLKDFRSCAELCTSERLRACLFGNGSRFVSGATGLNWDPADQRSKALTWFAPEDKKNNPKQTDPAANALAFVGLGLLTAVPVAHGLTAVGWRDGKFWTWPIWGPPLALSVVKSLLACETIQHERPDLPSLAAQGVLEVLRCEKINPDGKRCFFAPSTPV